MSKHSTNIIADIKENKGAASILGVAALFGMAISQDDDPFTGVGKVSACVLLAAFGIAAQKLYSTFVSRSTSERFLDDKKVASIV